MNINKFTEIFFEFEKKFSYFDKNFNKTYWWDIVRHDVYYLIYHKLNNKKSFLEHKKKPFSHRLFARSKSLFYSILIVLKIFFLKPRNIYLRYPRFINNNGNFDYPIDYIIASDAGRSLAINQNYIYLVKRKSYLLDKNEIDNLKNDIQNFFKITIDIDIENFVNERIYDFYSQFFFYNFLFNFSNTKSLIISVSGIQKGVYLAAKRNKVKILEVQHGLICKDHPAYSYPSNIININKKIYVPNVLLVYSKYFKNLKYNFPDVEKIVIGKYKIKDNLNNFSISNTNYDLLVISAEPYNYSLIEAVKIISINNPNQCIAYKLHPNETLLKDQVISTLKEFKNIHVIDTNINIESLLKVSKKIMLVQSTVIYSAIEMSKEIFILPIFDYHIHEDLFGLECIKVVDDIGKIYLTESFSADSDEIIFFENFKIPEKIKRMINLK